MWNLSSPIWFTAANWVLGALGIVGMARSIQTQQPGWLVAMVPVFLLFFFVTPYQLWKEEHAQVEAVTKRLEPKISAEGTIRDIGAEKVARLIVRNMGELEPLKDCIGHLRSVSAEIGGKLRNIDTLVGYYKWAATFQSERENPRMDINREAELNVAVLRKIYEGWIEIPLVGVRPRPRIEECQSYVFEIELSAANAASRRIRMSFKISPTGIRSKPDPSGQLLPVELPNLEFTEMLEESHARPLFGSLMR